MTGDQPNRLNLAAATLGAQLGTTRNHEELKVNLTETMLFLSQLAHPGSKEIGALIPSSRQTAQALIAEAVRNPNPKKILEAGPGTGPVTMELVKHLKPEDRLVLCELNPDFCQFLKDKFETDPELVRFKDQVEILNQSATDLQGDGTYDYIICAIPFTQIPSDVTQAILDTFQRLLKPGGSFTYLEYAFLREIRRMKVVPSNPDFFKVDEILKAFVDRYQYREEQVLFNVPPANIRSLRFSEPQVEEAHQLNSRKNYKRLTIPGTDIGFNTEATDLVAGLAGLAAVLAAKKSKWWIVPAAMSAGTAWFHRDPQRTINPNRDVAFAASDGTVMKVDTIRHPRMGDQELARVAVFLSPLDVHINRAPVAGKVVDRWDEPGGFMPAFEDESELNSSRFIVIEGEHGRVAVAQRAGFLARRIMTWPKKGELLTQGERYGLIRFGSRTDILFPLNQVEILVKSGDKLAAGQTLIARYKTT